uniref:Uncharacterized protein n=1 Tax=Arundo donax TaxID=35708 RepID=A0A0A9C100_ARUDO
MPGRRGGVARVRNTGGGVCLGLPRSRSSLSNGRCKDSVAAPLPS